MAAVKRSPSRSSVSSVSSVSSPEASVPEQAQPIQKRKGGRKPVYATQEERKMRNRAAQAAFRERRTEYIKHLEATIKHQEEQLSGLQQSARIAADEVLMLRYKNSLLERILVEKGIDISVELRAFAQVDDRSPPVQSAVPRTVPPISAQIPLSQQQGLLHRPAVGRGSALVQAPAPLLPPPPKHSLMNPIQPDNMFVKRSPESLRPPVPTSPSAMPTPPGQSSFHLTPQSNSSQPEFQRSTLSVNQTYYPSPYQTHMEELVQEYDAELLDNSQDGSPRHIDQQPTPDGHGDREISMRGSSARTSQPRAQSPHTHPQLPPPQTHPHSSTQSGIYNVSMFDSGFESMFGSSQAPKAETGMADVMRQYNHMPFGFATSNLR